MKIIRYRSDARSQTLIAIFTNEMKRVEFQTPEQKKEDVSTVAFLDLSNLVDAMKTKPVGNKKKFTDYNKYPYLYEQETLFEFETFEEFFELYPEYCI